LGTLLQKQTREPAHEGDEEEIHDRGRALAGDDAGSVVVGTDGMRVVCVLLFLLCGGWVVSKKSQERRRVKWAVGGGVC
jgi:hypothetical protein